MSPRPVMKWAACAGAALALAACGPTPRAGTGFGSPSPQPVVADPSESAAPSAAPSTARPRVKLGDYPYPKDFKVVFPDYPGEDAEIVGVFRDFWGAWWYSVTTHGRDDRYRDYLTLDDPLSGGLTVFPEVVSSWQREGVRPTGTLRVDKLRSTLVEKDKFGFVGCVDASKLGTKATTSGEERWTLGKRKTSRYQMRVMMMRTADGWKVRAFMSDYEAKECR
ncbi:MAG: hypothetical protein HOV86_10785 [Thermoactinospora sp.]|nr:hypothetical protein [Thermoactinospora sp.]